MQAQVPVRYISHKMRGSYAAIWHQMNDQTISVGNVQLDDHGIRLDDGSLSGPGHTVPFTAITHVRMATPSERLYDIKTVIVEPYWGHPLRIAALGLGGALELATLITESLPS